MARIYLDARNITAQPAGVARYALSLIPELLRQAPEHEFVVIRHTSNRTPIDVPGFALREVFVDPAIDSLENFACGAHTLRKVFKEVGAPDIYHNLFHISPFAIRRAAPGAKVVVTLHDLVWIDHPHQSQPTWLKAETIRAFASLAIPHSLKSADHVICISEPTAQRATPWLRPDQFSLISHGVSDDFQTPAAPPEHQKLGLPSADTPYIVAIGNAKPYKNLDRLIDAFARVRPTLDQGHLVLIGNCADLAPQVRDSEVAQHITLAGILSDAELRSTLGHARLFVFPSLVEGFGLPILEAMAMGIPTLVSDLEPMRSIAQRAAILFNPNHTGDLARAMRRVLEDSKLRERLIEDGYARAAQFNWPKTAAKTLGVYTQVLGE
ncbi:glycosyltransferase family 4 protein [Bradymonas sediminis]|uniref:Uncharacterized protein n=1 Tax=Bradymonas sediminis TaxID=1548548 RepID=A0A2Z4FI98_9DELT|nr:glycosyltransferase family 1 protein [Bradymonas sediminis]AWV88629.1 hypothetical protein DN745_04470 [Bradymonas sediminis]TDP63687.1 glycosyltransferase involved in cell wall biosynthesis [Bradymonas sediminis]